MEEFSMGGGAGWNPGPVLAIMGFGSHANHEVGARLLESQGYTLMGRSAQGAPLDFRRWVHMDTGEHIATNSLDPRLKDYFPQGGFSVTSGSPLSYAAQLAEELSAGGESWMTLDGHSVGITPAPGQLVAVCRSSSDECAFYVRLPPELMPPLP
jgi:hypothetical protein